MARSDGYLRGQRCGVSASSNAACCEQAATPSSAGSWGKGLASSGVACARNAQAASPTDKAVASRYTPVVADDKQCILGTRHLHRMGARDSDTMAVHNPADGPSCKPSPRGLQLAHGQQSAHCGPSSRARTLKLSRAYLRGPWHTQSGPCSSATGIAGMMWRPGVIGSLHHNSCSPSASTAHHPPLLAPLL